MRGNVAYPRVHSIIIRCGSLQRFPDPLAGFKGPTSKGTDGKGREGGEGGEGRGKEKGKGKGGRERERKAFPLL